MKKVFIILIILIIICPKLVLADEKEDENDDAIIETSNINTIKELNVFSKHAIVMDRKTLSVLYEKDAYAKVAMASTTKIMTSIIVLENCNLNESVTISSTASNVRGSCLGLNSGDKITMNDLLYGLMLRSRK